MLNGELRRRLYGLPYSTAKELIGLIANEQDFRGSNCYGLNFQDEYVIYSYGQAIFQLDKKKDTYSFDNRKYSNSTTRLQNVVIKANIMHTDIPMEHSITVCGEGMTMKDKIIMVLVLASLVIDWDTTLRNFGL